MIAGPPPPPPTPARRAISWALARSAEAAVAVFVPVAPMAPWVTSELSMVTGGSPLASEVSSPRSCMPDGSVMVVDFMIENRPTSRSLATVVTIEGATSDVAEEGLERPSTMSTGLVVSTPL